MSRRTRADAHPGLIEPGAGLGVNLLPSSVHAAKDLRRLRGRLALGLVLVVAAVVGGYGYLLTAESSALGLLTAAEAEATRLETERAGYVEVEDVRAEAGRARTARTLGMGLEIRWNDLISRIEAVIPAGTEITSFSGTGPSAAEGNTWVQADPLAPDGVGSIAFTIATPTLPDTAAWLDALNGIEGFTNASFSSATLNDSQDLHHYTVVSTVQLDWAALSHAFLDLPDTVAPEAAG